MLLHPFAASSLKLDTRLLGTNLAHGLRLWITFLVVFLTSPLGLIGLIQPSDSLCTTPIATLTPCFSLKLPWVVKASRVVVEVVVVVASRQWHFPSTTPRYPHA